MGNVIRTIGTENFMIILLGLNIILLIAFVMVLIKVFTINKKYKDFIQKLGNGKNIEEDLENYMYRVERVEKQNAEITDFIQKLDNDFEKSIQKVGIVRYNAYKDTGSDLSFTLAMLDENNNGVVLNGIYSRETSNIYAKPVEKGNSKYTLSNEELQAIDRAINSNNLYKIR